MSTNAFIGRMDRPTESDLATVLGSSKAAWDRLLTDLADQYGVSGHEWKSYSPKAGWTLRLTRKTRTIVWLAPSHHAFEVLFILGEKAMRVVHESAWPQRVRAAIENAPKYPEGTGIRLQVRSSRDIGALKKLAAIKLAN
jgi:hypothetical protein